MNLIGYIIIFFIIGLIGGAINQILFENTKIEKIKKQIENNEKVYTKKDYLTETEKNFYRKLKKLEPQYKVIPQINLSTIINKTSNTKYHTELYRNIDYGIFTNDFQLLLLIELNDQTHNQSKRKYRDIKVREICKNANIPIMTFYTNYPNEENYVINRILKEIQPSSNNNDVSILEEKDKNNMVQE